MRLGQAFGRRAVRLLSNPPEQLPKEYTEVSGGK